MTKRELINEIMYMNRTAGPDFLARFEDRALQDYLGHLRWARRPRIMETGYVAPASVKPTVDANATRTPCGIAVIDSPVPLRAGQTLAWANLDTEADEEMHIRVQRFSQSLTTPTATEPVGQEHIPPFLLETAAPIRPEV